MTFEHLWALLQVLIPRDLHCPEEIVQVCQGFVCTALVEGDSARRPGRQLKKEKRQPKLPFSRILPKMNNNLGRESVQEANWTETKRLLERPRTYGRSRAARTSASVCHVVMLKDWGGMDAAASTIAVG